MRVKTLLIVGSMLLGAAAPAFATILTFQAAGVNQEEAIPDSYGDNVVASPDGNGHQYEMGNGWTPNIDAAYSGADPGPYAPAWRFWPGWDGAGNVAYLPDGYGYDPWQYWLTLTPDAGYGVKINSFDLNTWGHSEWHQIAWTVFADAPGGTVLDSGNTGDFADDITVPTNGVVHYGTVVLELWHTGPNTYLAADNVNFDQVPEPASLALLTLGGLGLLVRRRRA
jgi:hypothetical protein